jgi:DNA-binding NarL/FixJ family response regulator
MVMSKLIGIATDSPFLAETLRNLLPAHSRAVSVYTCEPELLAGLEKESPRIIFMENTFDGFGTEDCIYRLARQYRSLRIAVWTAGLVMPSAAARFIAAGADSFISLRETGEEALKAQIETILSGRPYYPAEIEKALDDENCFPDYRGNVTGREAEIIRRSLNGDSIRDIASLMGIEPVTVKTHKNHIFKKCGGRSYAVLLRYALSHGIISLDELGDRKHDSEE